MPDPIARTLAARPLASVLLLTYQQEAYVQSALVSLLDQDYPHLEILVLDDASSDRTLAIVRETLRDHPRQGCVRVMVSERNHGLAANWNRGVAAAAGDVIIAAAGDDVSRPARVREAMEFFADNPSVYSLYGNCRIIDEAGRVRAEGWRATTKVVRKTLGPGDLWKGFPFNGATAAYRVALLRAFGPIDRRCGTEDVSSLMRAQLAGEAAVLPGIHVDWRWHGANLSHGGVTAAVPRITRFRSKLRKARGACYDGLQLERDARRAVDLGLRSAAEVAGMLSVARKMQLVNRLRLHALHPCSRWAVFIRLLGTTWSTPHLAVTEKVTLTLKCLIRRAFPRAVRHWGA